MTHKTIEERHIRCLILDIDGVLTDGTAGVVRNAEKRLFLRDLDALTEARKAGLQVAFLTGEEYADEVVARCGGGELISGCRNKEAGLRDLAKRLGAALGEVCYVGDADRDAPALRLAGLGLAPHDAGPKAIDAADRVLRAPGGRGAVAEAVEIVRRMDQIIELTRTVQATTRSTTQALGRAVEALGEMTRPLTAIAEALVLALERGSKILLFGNGGSAAMAQHAAAELVGRFRKEAAPLPALALTADTSAFSAVANDYGYENAFSRQIRAHGRPGDVAIGFSTSGRSPNVLRGLETAAELRMVRVGFAGSDSRDMQPLCHHLFGAPSDDVPRVQELHIVAWHMLCEVLDQYRLNHVFPEGSE